jgi:hypothetical protein
MSAVAERPGGFEPHVDYLRTYEAIESAFAANADHIYEPTEGFRILAGNIAVTTGRLSHLPINAHEAYEPSRVRVTLVETEDPEFGMKAYRHDFLVFDAAGEQLGKPDAGIYHLDASESEWKKRTQMGGERHRELVSGARYELLEAQLVAQDEVHAAVLDNAERDETNAERAAHWLVRKQMWSRRLSRVANAMGRWCAPLLSHIHVAADTHSPYWPGENPGPDPGHDATGTTDTAE